jgi:hypothetical protein
MVTKNKTVKKKGKVKVGKLNLKLNKETVKHLAAEDLKRVKGGNLFQSKLTLHTK